MTALKALADDEVRRAFSHSRNACRHDPGRVAPSLRHRLEDSVTFFHFVDKQPQLTLCYLLHVLRERVAGTHARSCRLHTADRLKPHELILNALPELQRLVITSGQEITGRPPALHLLDEFRLLSSTCPVSRSSSRLAGVPESDSADPSLSSPSSHGGPGCAAFPRAPTTASASHQEIPLTHDRQQPDRA
jgi:hypothetical protein